jgi:hypothetical protein
MSQLFPVFYEELILITSYYSIYAVSYVEIHGKKMYDKIKNKIKNKIIHKIKENPFLFEYMNKISTPSELNVDIVVDNKIIDKCTKEKSYLYMVDSCKFIIYSEPVPQTSRINKKIIYNAGDINNDSFKIRLCNYMFISMELHILNDLKQMCYDLNLFFNGNNYYIVNNKIDKYVICFLLLMRYGINQNPETCKYKLSIIDDTANMFHLCERDFLYLYEDKYEIVEVIGHNHYDDKTQMSCTEDVDDNGFDHKYDNKDDNKT